MSFPQHDPITHERFLCSLVFKHAKEYSRTIYTLAPFPFVPMSFDTTSTFTTLHLELNIYFLFFLKDYELDQNFELFLIPLN
jgi:hypothetical protein